MFRSIYIYIFGKLGCLCELPEVYVKANENYYYYYYYWVGD